MLIAPAIWFFLSYSVYSTLQAALELPLPEDVHVEKDNDCS